MKIFYCSVLLVILAFPSISHAQNPCDGSLWKHVWEPGRLSIIESCKTVTGVIVQRIPVPDGDEHMRLRLDPGQPGLLNAENVKGEDSCLVLEIICHHVALRPAALGYCKGCKNNIKVPKKGAHVRVTGTYVTDNGKHHGWREIHPVYSIESIK
jgi:hypothetical protein